MKHLTLRSQYGKFEQANKGRVAKAKASQTSELSKSLQPCFDSRYEQWKDQSAIRKHLKKRKGLMSWYLVNL